MSSDAITEKVEQNSMPGGWRPTRESAPSVMRKDEPTLARWIGLGGLAALTLGSVILLAAARQAAHGVAPTAFGTIFVTLGLVCLLFHAARETDSQIRRIYWIVGLLWLAVGILVSALPFRGAPAGALFLPYGFTSMALALLFLLPTVRNETEESYRQRTMLLIGMVGAILAATGFIGGNVSESFLLPYGLLLLLLGLMYLWAFVGLAGSDGDVGYRVGQAVGFAGGLFFLVALGRSFIPWLLYLVKIRSLQPESYFVPSGLLLGAFAFLYLALSIGLCSDWRFVVLTRRELAAFFYSPIAYFVFFKMNIVALWVFFNFVSMLFGRALLMQQKTELPEPILVDYVIGWFPIIATIFVVPVLTMRLLSEENKTGTLEVLFTAPVTETSVVLSKFLATFVVFLLAWLPTGLYLIALRVEGGQEFEYAESNHRCRAWVRWHADLFQPLLYPAIPGKPAIRQSACRNDEQLGGDIGCGLICFFVAQFHGWQTSTPADYFSDFHRDLFPVLHGQGSRVA
jgi:ABC-2 type transport system permease protein